MSNFFTIENDFFTAKIDAKGAQLMSLVKKTTQYEYIWQRNPEFWKDSAPNLFPIVGHLKNGSFKHKGKTYQMPKHGIVRHEPFTLFQDNGDNCTVVYRSNPDSKQKYPFDFDLFIDFALTNTGLKITYIIKNKDEEVMPVGLGYHPAFAIDIENYRHEDYDIVFNQTEQLDLYGLVDNLFGLKQKDYLNKTSIIPLSPSLFDNDALIFTNIKSDTITIKRKTDDWFLSVHTGGAPHLGIWAKSKAPYVCIEPWYTYLDTPEATDNLFDKPGTYALAPGEALVRGYEIEA